MPVINNAYRAARAAYEANRVYCAAIGDPVAQPWIQLTDKQQTGYLRAVEFVINNWNASPADQHDKWMEARRAEGWKYGPVKNDLDKTHPNFVPYDQLPTQQKAKDDLFRAIVKGVCG
jgi:hypothetical protein